MPDSPVIDLHQHLWPKQPIEVLRRRCHPPIGPGGVLRRQSVSYADELRPLEP